MIYQQYRHNPKCDQNPKYTLEMTHIYLSNTCFQFVFNLAQLKIEMHESTYTNFSRMHTSHSIFLVIVDTGHYLPSLTLSLESVSTADTA